MTDILNVKYQRATDCSFRDIAGEVVVVSSKTGGVHMLNPVASLIWNLLDGKRPCKEFVEEIRNEFDVTAEVAMEDIADFVGNMIQAEIVTACN